MLLRRSFRKKIYFVFIVTVILSFISRPWDAQPLIAALPDYGFIDYTEVSVPFLLIIPISFLLYDNYEIELALVCGVKTVKLLFTQIFAVFVYTLIPLVVMIFNYKYQVYYNPQSKIVIPIYIPDNHRVYMLVSMVVTVFFFMALLVFMRVSLRNCYASVVAGLFTYSFFTAINKSIHSGRISIDKSLFDPFISNYLLGDHIPNTYYSPISGIQNIWTYNRLLFFGIGIVLFVLSYMLLKREKLHESFMD